MIKVGNILIDPQSTVSMLCEQKYVDVNKEKGLHHVQIIYKSGVVKNMTSQEIGMPYNEFIDQLMELDKKAEDRKILKLIAACKSHESV